MKLPPPGWVAATTISGQKTFIHLERADEIRLSPEGRFSQIYMYANGVGGGLFLSVLEEPEELLRRLAESNAS